MEVQIDYLKQWYNGIDFQGYCKQEANTITKRTWYQNILYIYYTCVYRIFNMINCIITICQDFLRRWIYRQGLYSISQQMGQVWPVYHGLTLKSPTHCSTQLLYDDCINNNILIIEVNILLCLNIEYRSSSYFHTYGFIIIVSPNST